MTFWFGEAMKKKSIDAHWCFFFVEVLTAAEGAQHVAAAG